MIYMEMLLVELCIFLVLNMFVVILIFSDYKYKYIWN